jgi:transposase
MDARTRLGWVRLYEQVGNAGIVCRRCGISRPTLRKWWRRYRAEGEAGLRDRSRRPHRSPGRKVLEREEALVLELRRERKLGIKRLRNELIRQHGLKLALDTIHKVLVRHGANRLGRPRLKRKGTRRYSRPVPGDRVQMDTCKIAPGLYQYTAIDDCSRWQVLGLYPRRTAANTLAFLERLQAEMPFPVQRVQTDRGQEFFAYEVQDELRERHIEFRPNRPRAPHLNGKVERVQRTVRLLERCRELGLLKARGRQRTDATHVLAAIRVLNRLELVGETLRAALNELATVAPDWLRAAAPEAWHKRYAHRVEDHRLPRAEAEREPTRARWARTGSPCSPGSTSLRRPEACGGCRGSRRCGRSGRATSSASRPDRPRAAGACASGARATRRRRRRRSCRPTTPRPATAAGTPPCGPATSCT